MKKIKNSSIAYVFYALATIDYVSANFFNNDLTGLPFSPIILGGIGSVFMFIHNSYIKESNNKIYELFKFSLYAVLISDDRIDESELEYSSSILNTLENELLLPTNPSKLEEELVNYNLNNLYEKIRNLQSSVPYNTKLDILSSCAILCVMDGQIDEVEQESIYQISNILDISPNDMKNIFNASIASYIDFQNSDREKLQINDSEVKKVVEEKRKENKSNKNQVYIGIGVFTSLVFFGVYQSFQVTIEESCDNFAEYTEIYNNLRNENIEQESLLIDYVNDFYNNLNKDTYLQLSSDDQIKTHNEIFLGWDDNISTFKNNIENLSNIPNFITDNEHEDILQLSILHNEFRKDSLNYFNNRLAFFELIPTKRNIYEKFFYDWDNSNNLEDKNNAQSSFDSQMIDINDNLDDLDNKIKNNIQYVDESGKSFLNVANNVCLDYSFYNK